jgi:hypothetical protein
MLEPPNRYQYEGMPARATVAVGIRALRRVQPLLTEIWGAPRECVDAVDRAIASAESYVRGGSADPEAGAVLFRLLEHIDRWPITAIMRGAAILAQSCPSEPVCTAAPVVCSINATPPWTVLVGRELETQHTLTRAVWHDVKALHHETQRLGWTDETAIDPDVFGPLWPEGEPDWIHRPSGWDPWV